MGFQRAILILALCFTLAFSFAVACVVVMTLTLPTSDAASGSAPFGDPLVLPIMSMIASIAAIIVYPFTYFSLRDRPLVKSFAILAAIVLSEIVFVTPINPPLGFLGSFVAYGVGLYVARSYTMHFGAERSHRTIQFGLRGIFMVFSYLAALLSIYFLCLPNRTSQRLVEAANRGDLKSVDLLLAKGAHVDYHDGWSSTPLMYASANGYVGIVKSLVGAGADINERSRLDRTPLMWAANDGHENVIRYLLAEGANPALLDQNGDTAAELAGKNGFAAIATQLRTYDAPPKTKQVQNSNADQ